MSRRDGEVGGTAERPDGALELGSFERTLDVRSRVLVAVAGGRRLAFESPSALVRVDQLEVIRGGGLLALGGSALGQADDVKLLLLTGSWLPVVPVTDEQLIVDLDVGTVRLVLLLLVVVLDGPDVPVGVDGGAKDEDSLVRRRLVGRLGDLDGQV